MARQYYFHAEKMFIGYMTKSDGIGHGLRFISFTISLIENLFDLLCAIDIIPGARR